MASSPASYRPSSDMMAIAVIVAVLAAVPVVASLVGDPFLVKIATRVVVFAIAAVALNLVLGFGGLVSLMHAGLFGIGGYVVAILAFHADDGSRLFDLFPGTTELSIGLPLAMLVAGAALAGLAGIMAGPINAVQVGMGEPVLILALVVTVIGGVGSIKGAFIAALMIGVVDTFGRVLLPPALGSMMIFMLMAVILAWRPRGLFPVHG